MVPTQLKQVLWLLSFGILLGCRSRAVPDNSPQIGDAQRHQVQKESVVRSYAVNKKVSEFPPLRDLSTPEAAYATIMRDFMATGASDSEWSEISTWRSQKTDRTPVSPERVSEYLNADIHEVIIYWRWLSRR
jgi:hypothetical protein